MPAVAVAREFDVVTGHGRTLRAHEVGDPAGALVVYHHGTPMYGGLMPAWSEDAAQRGIRLVGFDRAGYAGSTRQAGRRVADVTADTAAVADALGVERFCTWGISGGGPHALACAALLGDRVIAAASLAGVGPPDSPGLDFMAGMGQGNIDEFGAAAKGEQALGAFLAEARAGHMSASAERLRDELVTLLPDIDRTWLTGDHAEFLYDSMSQALRDGYEGWLDDDLAFVTSWGFEVASIDVPVLVLQGELDLMVPFAHGRWIAASLPGADVRLSADDGHLSLFDRVGEVHAWLLGHAST